MNFESLLLIIAEAIFQIVDVEIVWKASAFGHRHSIITKFAGQEASGK